VESASQHPTLQLVSAILNLEKDRFERDYAGGNAAPHYVAVIRYVSTGRSVLMNDSFPTVFPLGSGGHLPEPQERPVPVVVGVDAPQSKVYFKSLNPSLQHDRFVPAFLHVHPLPDFYRGLPR
jgi:hypothetical protein